MKPNLGPGISERVWEALGSTDEGTIDVCLTVKTELNAALSDLLGVRSLSLSHTYFRNTCDYQSMEIL